MSLLVQLGCDGHACTATTDAHASTRDVIAEARELAWLAVQVAGETQWFCPLHQRYDARLERWVANRDGGRRAQR